MLFIRLREITHSMADQMITTTTPIIKKSITSTKLGTVDDVVLTSTTKTVIDINNKFDNNNDDSDDNMYYNTNMKTNTNNHVSHEILNKLQSGNMLDVGLHKSLQVQAAAELCKYLKVVKCNINFINPIKTNE